MFSDKLLRDCNDLALIQALAAHIVMLHFDDTLIPAHRASIQAEKQADHQIVCAPSSGNGCAGFQPCLRFTPNFRAPVVVRLLIDRIRGAVETSHQIAVVLIESAVTDVIDDAGAAEKKDRKRVEYLVGQAAIKTGKAWPLVSIISVWDGRGSRAQYRLVRHRRLAIGHACSMAEEGITPRASVALF